MAMRAGNVEEAAAVAAVTHAMFRNSTWKCSKVSLLEWKPVWSHSSSCFMYRLRVRHAHAERACKRCIRGLASSSASLEGPPLPENL